MLRNEVEKKKHYNERVLNVENASFTQLVFNVNGGIGRENRTFFKRLTEMVAEKRKISTAVIPTKLSFSELRSMIL